MSVCQHCGKNAKGNIYCSLSCSQEYHRNKHLSDLQKNILRELYTYDTLTLEMNSAIQGMMQRKIPLIVVTAQRKHGFDMQLTQKGLDIIKDLYPNA